MLNGSRIVPVVVLDDASFAPDLATPGRGRHPVRRDHPAHPRRPRRSIRAIAGRSDFAVGAGTVTTVAQVDAAVDAGATYLVSPGFDDAVAERAAARGGYRSCPYRDGHRDPAGRGRGPGPPQGLPRPRRGRPRGLRAFAGPFPDVRFLTSGGGVGGQRGASTSRCRRVRRQRVVDGSRGGTVCPGRRDRARALGGGHCGDRRPRGLTPFRALSRPKPGTREGASVRPTRRRVRRNT